MSRFCKIHDDFWCISELMFPISFAGDTQDSIPLQDPGSGAHCTSLWNVKFLSSCSSSDICNVKL